MLFFPLSYFCEAPLLLRAIFKGSHQLINGRNIPLVHPVKIDKKNWSPKAANSHVQERKSSDGVRQFTPTQKKRETSNFS